MTIHVFRLNYTGSSVMTKFDGIYNENIRLKVEQLEVKSVD